METSAEASERVLMRLTLELALLLDSADDDSVDPDTAVNWLESIAAALQALPPDARVRLAGVARELATNARVNGRLASASFFDQAPEGLGFGAPDAR